MLHSHAPRSIHVITLHAVPRNGSSGVCCAPATVGICRPTRISSIIYLLAVSAMVRQLPGRRNGGFEERRLGAALNSRHLFSLGRFWTLAGNTSSSSLSEV
jgi:hypothetical protein